MNKFQVQYQSADGTRWVDLTGGGYNRLEDAAAYIRVQVIGYGPQFAYRVVEAKQPSMRTVYDVMQESRRGHGWVCITVHTTLDDVVNDVAERIRDDLKHDRIDSYRVVPRQTEMKE